MRLNKQPPAVQQRHAFVLVVYREDKEGPAVELESIEFVGRLAVEDEGNGESKMTLSFST